MKKASIQDVLEKNRIMVIDGSMATALEALGTNTNSRLVYDPATKTWSVPEGQLDFGAYALSYMKAGAAAVGGCCTTNAEHIRQVAKIRDTFAAMDAKTVTYKK